MKIELKKEHRIDGTSWMLYYENDNCEKAWLLGCGGEKEAEAHEFFNQAKERLSAGLPKKETIAVYDTESTELAF